MIKILHIEDEDAIRDITKLSLESAGEYEVTSCSSGDEALKILADFSPNLILLDVMMPGLDGPETLKAIRKLPHGKDLPIIFMTAKVMETEIKRLKELGSIGIIAKPFDPMSLSNEVQKIYSKVK